MKAIISVRSYQINHIVKHTGYVVQLGAGSAYGGNWVPKKEEDQRFLGEPGEINRFGYYETKIGQDGRATIERHNTNHGNPKIHSNPHDHQITWSQSWHPIPGPQINYWHGNLPEFKSYAGGNIKMGRVIKGNTQEQNAFTSIADFQSCMRHGGEVQFTYNGRDYGVFPWQKRTPESEYQFYIWQTGNDDSEAWYDTSDALLDYIIDGKKLREIITEVVVFDRTV